VTAPLSLTAPPALCGTVATCSPAVRTDCPALRTYARNVAGTTHAITRDHARRKLTTADKTAGQSQELANIAEEHAAEDEAEPDEE
jgi:hypothetical protein